MGKLSRNKGAAWEREVASRMTEATGVECKRCLIETREGNSGDITTELPYSVQCKVGQRPNPIAALEEARESAIPGEEMPVAIIKRNQHGKEPMREVAVIDFEDFLMLADLHIKALKKAKE